MNGEILKVGDGPNWHTDHSTFGCQALAPRGPDVTVGTVWRCTCGRTWERRIRPRTETKGTYHAWEQIR